MSRRGTLQARLSRFGAVVITSMATVTAAHAYDGKGQFMMGGGVGGLTCPAYVTIRNDLQAGVSNGVTTWQKMASFTMFIEGYRTAYNELQPGAADIFQGLQDDQLLAWTENWCRANPLERFSTAVIALARHQHEQR